MFDNSGYAAFANSLSNAGAAFGNALQERNRRQSLADLGKFAEAGDWQGLSKAAFEMGNQELGLGALAKAQEQKNLLAQRSADDAALGVAGGTAQGGVTVNPNPQPMALPGGLPANDEISQYIVQSAKQRGIDPGIALKVYRSEGAGGYTGDKNSSFGPFQLHYGGVAPGGNAVAGLGDEFTKATGLDARNPSTWKQQVDFALEKAKSGGWGPWHGWKGDKWAGLRGVQVADASGRIPDNVFQQPPQATPVDGLMARRENILRALSARGISDNARAQLNTLLKDTEFQIERSDRQAKAKVESLSPYEKKLQEERAKNDAEMEQTRATAARQGETMLPFIDRAEQAYRQLAERKALGPMMSSGINRTLEGSLPVGKWNEDEALRQEFEAAQRELELMKAQISMKGQGQITESERKLLGMTFPRLDAADPNTGLKTLQMMRDNIKKLSGDGGKSLSAPSAFDIQKAKEALAAGRSQQEVIDFLRSKGMSADGLF